MECFSMLLTRHVNLIGRPAPPARREKLPQRLRSPQARTSPTVVRRGPRCASLFERTDEGEPADIGYYLQRADLLAGSSFLDKASNGMATATADEGNLRRRSPTPTLVPSVSESSISDYEQQPPPPHNDAGGKPPTTESNSGNATLQKIVGSTAFKKRLSRQSSLSWGHKPSPLIGASCFLFLLPIPLLLRACCPFSALMLGCVTASSYMSDHVYTGVESWAHTFDRVMAPLAFGSCMYSTYYHCGIWWALSSFAALKCHVWANYYSKKGMYDQFVLWHSLWHVVGVGLILVCFTINGVVGQCWKGTEWNDFLHEPFMT